MLKNMARILVVLVMVGVVSGCSSIRQTVKEEPNQKMTTTRKIETRFYAQDRKREDQNMDGNFGYLAGTPVPEDRSQFKDTRKIYVLEVTKNVDKNVKMLENVKVEPYEVSPSSPLPPVDDMPEPEWSKPIVIPEIQPEEAGELYYEDYVIEEGDTLQKISKKFYGSYSKWVKIFEVNEEALKDPNRIKPGVQIKIPMYK